MSVTAGPVGSVVFVAVSEGGKLSVAVGVSEGASVLVMVKVGEAGAVEEKVLVGERVLEAVAVGVWVDGCAVAEAVAEAGTVRLGMPVRDGSRVKDGEGVGDGWLDRTCCRRTIARPVQ